MKTLNQIRSHTLSARNNDSYYVKYQAMPIYSDTHVIAMRKGDVVGVFSNMGSNANTYTINLWGNKSGFGANQQIVQVLGGNCNVLQTDDLGGLNVNVGRDPVVLYPVSALQGSGLCGR